jgi:phosphoribosyl-ATP pyrophosphohydrolase/phosphoribosyl-AMP cyclohydrolase
LVTFYSRSRDTLWTKGETSGNALRMKKIIVDCDRDTLLIMARPDGPVCHDGPDTCFNEINEPDLLFLDYLQEVIKDRKREMPENSYTVELLKQGPSKIAQKVGEESVELILESMKNDDQAFLNESADLLFHVMILLVDRGYTLQDVAKILAERHKD